MCRCPNYLVLSSLHHGNRRRDWPLSICVSSVYSAHALLQTRRGNTLCFVQTVGQPRMMKTTELGDIVTGKAVRLAIVFIDEILVIFLFKLVLLL